MSEGPSREPPPVDFSAAGIAAARMCFPEFECHGGDLHPAGVAGFDEVVIGDLPPFGRRPPASGLLAAARRWVVR